MNHPCCEAPARGGERPTGTSIKLGDGLAFAASPVFAVMAMLTAASANDPAAVICGTAGAFALTGMTAMYAMMSVFHAGPWLGLLRSTGRPAGGGV